MKFLPHIQKTILPFYLAIFAVTNDIEISSVQGFIIVYKVCNINGKEYNDVALGYTWGRSDNVAPYKFFNKKLKANHKTYFNAGTKLNFEKNYTVEMRGTGYSKSSELGFENVGFFEKTVKNYFGFEAADYKKLPFTDSIK